MTPLPCADSRHCSPYAAQTSRPANWPCLSGQLSLCIASCIWQRPAHRLHMSAEHPLVFTDELPCKGDFWLGCRAVDAGRSTLRAHACRGAVRLYADFYQSDIIVASPLALATALQEAETEGGPGVCISNLCHVGRHAIVKPEWDRVRMSPWSSHQSSVSRTHKFDMLDELEYTAAFLAAPAQGGPAGCTRVLQQTPPAHDAC